MRFSCLIVAVSTGVALSPHLGAPASSHPDISAAWQLGTAARGHLGALASYGAAEQAPKTAGEPVAVDFLALTSDGKPVLDLTAEEVQLRVDGRQRTIQLRLMRADDKTPPTPAAALPPPFGTNVAPPAGGSRTIYLAIEEDSLRPATEQFLSKAISEFLETLTPGDRIALVTLPRGSVRVDPTADHGRIREVLPKIAGMGEQSQQDACRTRETLEATKGLLEGIGGGGRAAATILFLSAGIEQPAQAPRRIGSTSATCDLTTEHFQGVGRVAAAARAHFYVIHASEAVAERNEGLETLASVTGGGEVVRLAAAGGNPLARIALETSASYTATFDPDPNERNGLGHRVELRVTRAGVAVRVRPEVVIARAGGGRGERGGRVGRGGALGPRDMLRVTNAFRDVPLRVVGYPSREGDKIKILVVAEPMDPSVKLTAAAAALVDAKSRLTSQWTARSEELARYPVITALIGEPGPYRLRFAATDAAGRNGAVDYHVDAELVQAGPVKLSGLALGVAGPKGFAPVLQFSSEDSAIAYLELYGQPTPDLRAGIELAATPDGPALVQAQVQGSTTAEKDRFILTGVIPIAALAPGDYFVRAVVGVEGQPEGRVSRTLRKVGK